MAAYEPARGDSAPSLAEVRNITVGRTVTLDRLAWRMLENTGFQLDRDTLEITAQRVIKGEMKEEVDASGLDFIIVRPAQLTDDPGEGTIQVVTVPGKRTIHDEVILQRFSSGSCLTILTCIRRWSSPTTSWV